LMLHGNKWFELGTGHATIRVRHSLTMVATAHRLPIAAGAVNAVSA